MSHQKINSLVINLTHVASGKSVCLFKSQGEDTTSDLGTALSYFVFDDSASNLLENLLTDSSTGSWKPFESLSIFNSKTVNSLWELWISDEEDDSIDGTIDARLVVTSSYAQPVYIRPYDQECEESLEEVDSIYI